MQFRFKYLNYSETIKCSLNLLHTIQCLVSIKDSLLSLLRSIFHRMTFHIILGFHFEDSPSHSPEEPHVVYGLVTGQDAPVTSVSSRYALVSVCDGVLNYTYLPTVSSPFALTAVGYIASRETESLRAGAAAPLPSGSLPCRCLCLLH